MACFGSFGSFPSYENWMLFYVKGYSGFVAHLLGAGFQTITITMTEQQTSNCPPNLTLEPTMTLDSPTIDDWNLEFSPRSCSSDEPMFQFSASPVDWTSSEEVICGCTDLFLSHLENKQLIAEKKTETYSFCRTTHLYSTAMRRLAPLPSRSKMSNSMNGTMHDKGNRRN